jgi:dihydroorotate dehydrogenase
VYKSLIRPLLFQFSAEKAHTITFNGLAFFSKVPGFLGLLKMLYAYKSTSVSVAGITFPNRIGLAAGFDKNAKLLPVWEALGFGHVEIGTVTPKPQDGNPLPRLFRLKKDEAIINRMGFNNEGAEAVAQRLASFRLKNKDFIIGGNIGKNKVTPNEDAFSDYQKVYHALAPYVNYFVVNVSSPNTPGLRELQEKEPLTQLLRGLMEEKSKAQYSHPIFLKIAPDLTKEQVLDIVEIVKETGIAGVVATNTTIERNGLITDTSIVEAIGAGGLSGKPVEKKATEIIKLLAENLPANVAIIGIGGIRSAETANEKLKAGAQLLQLYSGYIFEGPELIKKILKGIEKQ